MSNYIPQKYGSNTIFPCSSLTILVKVTSGVAPVYLEMLCSYTMMTILAFRYCRCLRLCVRLVVVIVFSFFEGMRVRVCV